MNFAAFTFTDLENAHTWQSHTRYSVRGLPTIISAICTLSGTLLIVVKIVLVTRQSRIRHSYGRVIEILVESAALVSTILLVQGILAVVTYFHTFRLSTRDGMFGYQLAKYLDEIQTTVVVRRR